MVAARAARDRGYALRPEPGVTGSIGKRVKSRSALAQAANPIKAKPRKRNILDDDDWIEDDGPRPCGLIALYPKGDLKGLAA